MWIVKVAGKTEYARRRIDYLLEEGYAVWVFTLKGYQVWTRQDAIDRAIAREAANASS